MRSIEERAQEFCDGAFGPFGVDVTPYAKIVSELIHGAVAAETAALVRQRHKMLKVLQACELRYATSPLIGFIREAISMAEEPSRTAEAIAAEAYKLCKVPLDHEGRKASALIDELTGGHALSWALAAALQKSKTEFCSICGCGLSSADTAPCRDLPCPLND